MQDYISFFQAHPVWCMAWLGIFVALIHTTIKMKMAKYHFVDHNGLSQLINRHDAVVFDLRTRDEFRQGHIANAIQVLPSEIQQGKNTLLEKYKQTPIILVCSSGMAAVKSAEDLTKANYEQVFVLKNGLASWREANMPLVQGKK
ncbi:putative protein YibN [Vibrio stylophorae]|uniref:Rhodanese domain-containing protein n=1 Tax=Vibrio stylophorae TaxID=659351 RepID=A0ABM8ZXC5_9VIBR|nr:rhodanese-like domain-containing protein [Vibrio stylophorae]CAH0534657.1 putative protein YibN [Vibrio stylophorae]